MKHCRTPWLLVAITFGAAIAGCDAAQASPAAAPAQSVLLELFSSEGCSSCPPAEAFLRAIDREQVPGVNVIALEYHVDYWDQLGWKDPFSIPEAGTRQEGYARVLGGGVFTPELIAQGRRIVAGAERSRPAQWLADAGQAAKSPPKVTITSAAAGTRTHVALHVTGLGAAAHDTRDVFVVVSESGLSSRVQAGENRGETLRHAPVVRRILRVGEITGSEFTWQGDVELASSWNPAALRVVAFVQNRSGRQILAAAAIGS